MLLSISKTKQTVEIPSAFRFDNRGRLGAEGIVKALDQVFIKETE